MRFCPRSLEREKEKTRDVQVGADGSLLAGGSTECLDSAVLAEVTHIMNPSFLCCCCCCRCCRC